MDLKLETKKQKSQGTEPKKKDRGSSRSWLHSRSFRFLFFLALAFVFWVLNRVQSKNVMTIEVPIEIGALPPSSFLDPDSQISSIVVSLNDYGYEHIGYQWNGITPLEIDFSSYDKEMSALYLSKETILMELKKKFSKSAQVVSLSIDAIKIPLYRRTSKRVSIALRDPLVASSGCVITSTRIIPDSITVYGGSKILNSLDKLYVSDDVYSVAYKSSGTVAVELDVPKACVLEDKKIMLKAEVSELTQMTYETKLEVVNVPSDYVLKPLPSTVRVTLTYPVEKHNFIKNELVQVYVDYKDIEQKKDRLPVELKFKPSFVDQITIEPQTVQYVLEKY